MPRTARAAVGEMCYHVLNRGNNRATIFHSAADYARFVALPVEAQTQLSLDVFAACLMPNHFHLLVRPRKEKVKPNYICRSGRECLRCASVIVKEDLVQAVTYNRAYEVTYAQS